MAPRISTGLALLCALLACLQLAVSQSTTSDGIRYVTYTEADGTTVYLPDDRKPSLYTQNFGDCLGGSAINVTRFDAAYYQDNMTVLFHLAGNSGIANDSLMMYIGVFAYGEDRFDLVFNPCNANIYSLCPINSSVPITASGIIPVDQSDVANIPSIAFSIPDFEGEAVLRIFSNTTHQQIACYSAVVTNGGSFSQPASVGTILGLFTFLAMIASFATAIYGEAVPTMRLHYAHSLSVGVVFAVWQHIFFSGALSVNWPSVLVAWWSNFAWAGGMIYSSSMQTSINHLIGNNVGNTSEVGAAQAGSDNSNVGGGYNLAEIFTRALTSGIKRPAHHPLERDIASEIYGRDYRTVLKRDLTRHVFERALQVRDNTIESASDGYHWYGQPVGAGLPLPGNFSGFAGTLAEEGIRVSNAFMTGFLWFLILLVLLVAAVIAFKWALEGLARIKWIKQDRLKFFRTHWLGYTAVVALRTCFVAWFMIMFLTIFQFTFESSGGVKGVAAIVFAIFFIGMPTVAAYAFWYKQAVTERAAGGPSEHHHLIGGRLPIPRLAMMKKKKKSTDVSVSVSEAGIQHNGGERKPSNMPLWQRMTSSGSIPSDEEHLRKSIHDDEDYTMKFGWLASRFRRTRWWFFLAWLAYEFLRAIFYGGASGYAQAQVFGLLVIEVLAFGLIWWARPFEGQRLNILVVYLLGFSKVATVALSAAFDVQFNLGRIITTVIGIVIIVIQGILTIITMIAIVIGAISSYMSISRNREDFRPRKWHGLREKYFDHLDRTVNDLPPPPKPKVEPAPPPPEEPKQGFEMMSVRRMAKIEDEDEEFAAEMRNDDAQSLGHRRSTTGTPHNRSRATSRAASVRSASVSNLPFGARAHRPSWNTRDFANYSYADNPYAGEHRSSSIDADRPLPDEEPPVPPVPSVFRLSLTPSLGGAKAAVNLQPQPSTESLNSAAKASTTEAIDNIPAPRVRPRAGTYSSKRGSRSLSMNYSIPEGADSSDQLFVDASQSRPGSARGMGLGEAGPGPATHEHQFALTPAQETEEFFPSQSRARQE